MDNVAVVACNIFRGKDDYIFVEYVDNTKYLAEEGNWLAVAAYISGLIELPLMLRIIGK